jgi:predicted ester cyclase
MTIFYFDKDLNQLHKQIIWDYFHHENIQKVSVLKEHLSSIEHPDARWFGFAPYGEIAGIDAQIDEFWVPLQNAFPNLERQIHIFMGGASSGNVDGSFENRYWVGATGLFNGSFQQEWQIGTLKIPANQQLVKLRWAEFFRFEEKKIAETYLMLDLVDFFDQINHPILPQCKGDPSIYPAPSTGDGLLHDALDLEISMGSLQLIRDFLFKGLNLFDKRNLKSMGVSDFFHDSVRWYGPGGIGACLSLKAFEEKHQKPWLIAFPDRRVCDLDSLFAEGNYVASSGWTGVKATHTGPYLGYPASRNNIHFNGIDFWRREDGLFVENWVFVDMIHLFGQMGINLLDTLEL